MRAIVRFLASIKNLEQYKRLSSDKFEKKRIFRKTFCSGRNFLELKYLVDDLVDFLELSMFINASLP